MNKHDYFSFLKPILCFLFFTVTGVVFGMKTIEEPDSIKNTASKDFYIEHDKKRDLYFGIERITPENVDWWKKRLAYDAYMYFELKRNFDSKFKLGSSYNFYFRFFNEIVKNHEFMSLLKNKSDTYTNDWEKIEENNKYLQYVLGMFHYNFEHYKDGGEATWVAYVSSRPVNGLLCSEKDFNVASPDIKMTVTVKVSNVFYSLLGIFRSPIAKAFDSAFAKISMPLYFYVARAMEQIKPGAKYVVFRPYKPIINALESSGIHYSVSKDGKSQDKVPHICYEADIVGMHNFVLVDPRSDTRYKISDKHWFKKNPYLGFHIDVAGCPFVIIDRVELGEYTNKKQVYDVDNL